MPRTIEYDVAVDAARADAGARQASRAIRGLDSTVSGLTRRLGALGAAYASVSGVRQLGQLVKSSAELGDELTNLSRATGLGVEDLQVWTRVLTDAGATQDQVRASLSRINIAIQRAGQGSKTEAEAFRSLGVELGSVDEVMRQLLESTNPSNINERLPALQRLFGEDAVRAFTVALTGSTEAFDKLAESTSRLSGSDAASLSALNSQLEETTRLLRNELGEIVVEIADGFGLIGDRYADMIANLGQSDIEQEIADISNELAEANERLRGLVSGEIGSLQREREIRFITAEIQELEIRLSQAHARAQDLANVVPEIKPAEGPRQLTDQAKQLAEALERARDATRGFLTDPRNTDDSLTRQFEARVRAMREVRREQERINSLTGQFAEVLEDADGRADDFWRRQREEAEAAARALEENVVGAINQIIDAFGRGELSARRFGAILTQFLIGELSRNGRLRSLLSGGS